MMAAFSMLNVSCDPNGGGGTNGDFTPSDALKQALAEAKEIKQDRLQLIMRLCWNVLNCYNLRRRITP